MSGYRAPRRPNRKRRQLTASEARAFLRGRDMDGSDRTERHALDGLRTCATCHEHDDLDALIVRAGAFYHPGCEPETAGRDEANRIHPSVAPAREADR